MSTRDTARWFFESQDSIVEWAVEEGLFDPYILHCVFLAGGPGAGKTFISQAMFGGMGLKVINSDKAFAYLMRKHGLDPAKDVSTPLAQTLRKTRAKPMTATTQKLALDGRLGLIIDGTARDPEKQGKVKKNLEALGYDCAMVFVNTSLEANLKRNRDRGKEGERVVPDELVRKSWTQVQAARDKLKALFSPDFTEINNDKVLTPAEVKSKLIPTLTRKALKFLNRKIKNPRGRKWVQDQLKPWGGKAPRIGARL
jgi:predicted kinase